VRFMSADPVRLKAIGFGLFIATASRARLVMINPLSPPLERDFNQIIRTSDLGYAIVEARIQFEARSPSELREHALVRKYYLGV
jgi:hypothetical protein